MVVIILVLLGILWALYSTYIADPRRDSPPIQAASPATVAPSAPPKTESTKPPLPGAMRAYFGELLPNIQGVGKGITLINEVSQEASENPGAITDKDWQTKASLACVALAVSGDRLRAIGSVPKECSSLHEKVRRIGKLSGSVASNFARGVDRRRNDDLNAAARDLKELGEVTQSANADLNEIRSRYSIDDTDK